MEKKFYKYILFLFFLSIFGFYSILAKELPLSKKVIYIDPGHGGIDPGSIYKDIYEKDINLDICLKLKDKLEKMGATVYMTREGDYDLSKPGTSQRKKSDLNNRVRAINDSNADMYISIHLNATNSKKWHGAQVFYDDVNEENKKIALIMQKVLQKNLNTDREISEISNMLLNRKVTVPGILIEVGFLSNDNERYLLRQEEYQNKVADTITNGIIMYFDN
ncbi:MAG: N-acetylmuramoyl-L-alanine amidase CwlD [Bacilli bacterium]|nr:N-acetylmuramoyl-L-alanine amidase CwlD [Bacilli bacterium]